MHTEPVDETLLTRYLLGSLPEDEEVAVEDRAFSDEGYLAALESVEADLIDSYVRGDMPQSERRAFESRFLLSPGRRSKVEFARAFAKVAAESKEAPLPARSTGWRSLLSMFQVWSPALRFAAATAVLAAATGVSFLALDNSAMRSRVESLESQRRDFELREEGLRRQLTEAQKRASTTASVPAPVIASLVLLPGLPRSETSRIELVLPAAAQVAHIEIQLEPRDAGYTRFRAELRTNAGEDVVTRGSLVARRNATGFTVSFDVPASALDAGQYELALKGIPAGRTAEDIGFYYFRVRK